MDIFGIGPFEFMIVILLALVLLGPKDMEKTGRTIGRFLRDLTRSDGWRAFRDTSREIRNLPNRLIREANLEDINKDIGKLGKDIKEATDINSYGTWANPATPASNTKQPKSKPVDGSNIKKPPQSPSASTSKASDKESDTDA